MRGLWQAGVPQMKLRVYQLDRLLLWSQPRLHAHLSSIQLAPEVLVAQWFVTLFSYTIPLPLTVRLWDMLFLSGWTGMFRVALAVMQRLQGPMLGADLEGLGRLMREWKRGLGAMKSELAASGAERVLQEALQAGAVFATAEGLARLEEEFGLEVAAWAEQSVVLPPGPGPEPGLSKAEASAAAASSAAASSGAAGAREDGESTSPQHPPSSSISLGSGRHW